ncbi:MAG: YbhB/YbcL family Raf kinase inhibitor-like protein [Actinobacteria bacterium]|nr:YbhB/YbcL family Raf kinase inhibitor-like protein [Actinomycetota bacterium]MBW3650724.1 YbhB/YbcL family Raf kinase inhibitor-like protein [Actinomycetota bacterium]
MSQPVYPARRSLALVLIVLGGLVGSACWRSAPRQDPLPPATIKLTSEAFGEGAQIPERFSCEGENVSPPLAWSNLPDGAVELALVMTDPDAPGATFYHWIMVGIPASATSLGEGEVPEGAVEAESSSGKASYIGMCPPDGSTHRYVFTIYALNSRVEVPAVQPPEATVAAIEDAAVARGMLTGRFSR